MKIEKYSVPQSSFLAMEKDTALIIDMMLKNDRLKKLLYYPTRDCLEKPNLTEDQTLSLIGNQIKTIPKIFVNNEDLIYVLINFDGYTPNFTNPEFRNNIITFDVVCNVDNWQLKDFQLRPYRIAAELDTMFSNKHFFYFLNSPMILIFSLSCSLKCVSSTRSMELSLNLIKL